MGLLAAHIAAVDDCRDADSSRKEATFIQTAAQGGCTNSADREGSCRKVGVAACPSRPSPTSQRPAQGFRLPLDPTTACTDHATYEEKLTLV